MRRTCCCAVALTDAPTPRYGQSSPLIPSRRCEAAYPGRLHPRRTQQVRRARERSALEANQPSSSSRAAFSNGVASGRCIHACSGRPEPAEWHLGGLFAARDQTTSPVPPTVLGHARGLPVHRRKRGVVVRPGATRRGAGSRHSQRYRPVEWHSSFFGPGLSTTSRFRLSRPCRIAADFLVPQSNSERSTHDRI